MTPPSPTLKLKHMFLSDPQPAHPEPVEGPKPPQSLADIIREETDDGRLIVRFLIDLMQGTPEDAKPCHRLDAARQLLNLGWTPARAFIAANAPATLRIPPSPSGRGAGGEGPSLHHDLADIISEETEGGRTAVRFLVDVMQGNLQRFKPHHRLSAAKELLRRGFDSPTTQAETQVVAEVDDNPCRRDPDGIYHRDRNGNWQRDNTRSPVPAPDAPVRKSPRIYNRYLKEYGPFYFEPYDEEDYLRDCQGLYALRHIFGCEQAVKAAILAVYEYRRRIGLFDREPGQAIDPSLELSALPADAPLPNDIYGYPVLLRYYGSENVARVAAHAAYRNHRELRASNLALRERPGSAPPSPDGPSSQDPCPDWSEAPPLEPPSSSTPSPGPARISLDNRAIDSVTFYQYQYGDALCRSP